MKKMHDVVYDVREIIISVMVIVSTVMISHIITKKNKQKWTEMQTGRVHHASFVFYDLF